MTNPEQLEDLTNNNQPKPINIKSDDLPPLDLNGVVGCDPSSLDAEFYLIYQLKDVKE